MHDTLTPPADGLIRLNIGAGDTVIPGFTAIDRKFGTEAFPLDYPDNSVEEIRCVHMLEHLSFGDSMRAMEEWWRVLRPGGRLRVSVPDVKKVAALSDSDPRWAYYLMGGQTDADDFHKSAYDEERLSAYFEKYGFHDVQKWTSENTDLASFHEISLNLEGIKGAKPVEEIAIKVRAIMGLPRIGWNDAWLSITEALRPLNIPIETHTGCFWGQNVQKGLQRALDQGIDWVLMLDYDSMIMPCHVARLVQIMQTRPDIHAVAALQMRRGIEMPLMGVTGQTEIDITPDPVPVHTAHFGLTLLRTECLRKMPKPWMHAVPDANGEWGDGRRDDDITFWDKWRESGHTVYVAPDVRIGHLELVVSEFDDDLKPVHRHISAWWDKHSRAGHCTRKKQEI
jgi:predicted SAM-dependent methyltransferase